MNKKLKILGTRGIPAAHGGFETFAEHLAVFLQKRGWEVTVYCQEDGEGQIFEDNWNGIKRIRIPVKTSGAAGTIIFDWKATLHSLNNKDLVLTLGYNTAIFSIFYRLKGIVNLINMDGIEWHRQKWGKVAKAWFWLNDWAGSLLGNHLIADHPQIARHLETRVKPQKITTIAYGADFVEAADVSHLHSYGLQPKGYAILIARAEPENSILEVVQAWSARKRGIQLVILGKYDPNHAYQRAVKEAASGEVMFLGAIYDKPVVESLRFFAQFYVHGHQVGGTNPSLVEALGAGSPILAHDNKFNRWVAGGKAVYFSSSDECEQLLGTIVGNAEKLNTMKEQSLERYQQEFTWEQVLKKYEELFLKYI